MRPHLPTDQATEPPPDLLAAVLESLKVDSSALLVFEFCHPWGFSIDFRQPFSWTVVDGSVWVVAPRQPALRLDPGDTIILPRGADSGVHLFLSAPDALAYPSEEFWRQSKLERFHPGAPSSGPKRVTWGGSGALTRIVSWAFGFRDRKLGPLIAALPERMVIKAADVHGAFVDALLHFPFQAGGEAQPGYDAVATQTAQLLLTYLVRTYVLRNAGGIQGWLGGMSDARIARALAAMHGAPQTAWTVDTLAQAAGMSRSAFSARFSQTLGQTPARYLCQWRMHLAREALASGRSVTELAHSLGYQSEAAFRSAFKRSTGQQPRAYRKSFG